MKPDDILKDIRKELKITQEQFARDIGVSFSTLNRWERGHRSPSPLAMQTIKNICKQKGVSESLITELDKT
jgi:transcriptional regulator with XRE-family HTH domain